MGTTAFYHKVAEERQGWWVLQRILTQVDEKYLLIVKCFEDVRCQGLG